MIFGAWAARVQTERFAGPDVLSNQRRARKQILHRDTVAKRGGWFRLTKVRVKSDEPFEKALRRFKKKCNKEGIMQRLKEMKHYEKPSERRRRKLAKAIARNTTRDE